MLARIIFNDSESIETTGYVDELINKYDRPYMLRIIDSDVLDTHELWTNDIEYFLRTVRIIQGDNLSATVIKREDGVDITETYVDGKLTHKEEHDVSKGNV